MAYKTRQELFNNAWNGFVKQGWSIAYKIMTGCMYRGPNKTRCAIGWSIPDEFYRRRMEGKPAICPEVVTAANIDPEEFEFVRELQQTHDRVALHQFHTSADGIDLDQKTELKRRMTAFAAKYNLTIPNGVQ